MRFDLKVPFAEKDGAKKLGARWDAARKIWYVMDKEDMAPFSKWSPTAHDATSPAPSLPAKAAPRKASAVNTQESGKVYVGSRYVEQARVCDCLPWDVCDKCRAMAFPA